MQPLDALAAPGPILAASEGGASERAATAARGLCGALATHGGELARVAGGGSVSGATFAAAALVAVDALDVLTAAPLAPYWRGYVSSLSDALEGLCSLAHGAGLGTVSPLPAAGAIAVVPLDVAAAARGGLDALAVGLASVAYERGAAPPLDDADAAARIIARIAAYAAADDPTDGAT